MVPNTSLAQRFVVLGLIVILRATAQPSPDSPTIVLQIPLPAPNAEMKERMAELLESLPPIRMGWLDSFPADEDNVYIHGEPFDRSIVDILVQGTVAGDPSEPMWPGLRREFPAEVKAEILAGGPAAIEALLGIMIDEMENPYLEVPAVLMALWDRLSPEQKDMYLRHHIHPYIEMEPRYEQSSKEWIRAGAEARLSWPSTRPHPIPEATTEIFVDGRPVAQREKDKNWDQHVAGVERMGRAFNIVPVEVSEFALGPHTIRAVTRYSFVCEGRAYTGEADSGERAFEIIQPFMPNQLAAAPDREIDRQVREAFVVKEIDPQPIWSEEENELVAWAPQLVPGPGEAEGYAIHMPAYRVARGLPVDLAFEVEYHLLDNDDVVAGSPVTVRKSTPINGSFSFRPANPNTDRQRFIGDRDGYVPLRIVLTPSEQIAKDYGLTDYYDRPITIDNLRARVHRFDLAAVNEIKQSLERYVSELQSSLQLSDRQVKQLSRVARDLERGSAAAIINLRSAPEHLDTAVVPFLIRLLDVPEIGFMDSIPRNALNQLVWIGSPSVEALRKAIESESAQTRRYAALGLNAIGTPKAFEALAAARTSTDAEVRAIANAVERMAGADEPIDIPDPVLRQTLLNALGKRSGDFTRQDIADARLTRMYIYPGKGGLRCESLEGIQACRDLTSLTITENALTDITPISELSKLTSFEIGPGSVKDFTPLQSLSRLERLRIEHNPVTDIGSIAKLTGLRYEVELIGLGITDARPLANLTNVSTLRLDGNALHEVSPLAKLTNLNELSLSGNPVRNMRFTAKMPRLERLKLGDTEIRDIEFVREMPKLKVLDIGHTAVKNIEPIASVPRLRTLILDGLSLDTLESIDGTALVTITFSETQVSDLTPLQRFPKLAHIRAANARISDIGPLATLHDLQTLSLPGNRIEDASPIAGLTKLTEIDLSNNRIAKVSSLEGMTSLRQLLLHNNRIIDIEPLLTLSPNTHVMLTNNLLDCESIESHLPALKDRGIQVLYSGFCIASVEPSGGAAGETVTLTFTVRGNMGTVFYPVGDGGYYPKSVYLSRDGAEDIQAADFRIVDENRVECTFALGSAPRGSWDLHVDIDERKRGVLLNAFTIR